MVAARGRTDKNRNQEGEKSECLSIFYVCLSTHAIDRRLGERVKSDSRESTSDMGSPEAKSCFHRP